jgi:hypothetical protein
VPLRTAVLAAEQRADAVHRRQRPPGDAPWIPQRLHDPALQRLECVGQDAPGGRAARPAPYTARPCAPAGSGVRTRCDAGRHRRHARNWSGASRAELLQVRFPAGARAAPGPGPARTRTWRRTCTRRTLPLPCRGSRGSRPSPVANGNEPPPAGDRVDRTPDVLVLWFLIHSP